DELGPGQGDELALAAGESASPLADLVEVAAGQGGDELVGADGTRRLFHLFIGGVGAAVGDVVADGAREEKGLLGHVAQLLAVRGEVEVADVGAVDQYAPARR